MNKPEVEAVRFRGDIDVIATSGYPSLTLGNFFDGNNQNNTINTTTYANADAAASAINGLYKISSDKYGIWFAYGQPGDDGYQACSLSNLYLLDSSSDSGNAGKFNGEFEYSGKEDGSYFWYRKMP